MMRTCQQIAILTAKDLRIEAKSRQTITLVIVLGILILVVLGLGLGQQHLAGGGSATAVLWVAYLFGGVLCFEKTMAVERHDGALGALMLAPIDRGAIFLAKLLSNLVLMVSLAAVITPVAVVMFGFDLSGAPWRFGAIMGLSFIGFAAIGTLFAAAVSSSRLQGGMLAIVIFPICLPLVITSTRLMLNLYANDPGGPGGGPGVGPGVGAGVGAGVGPGVGQPGWTILIAFDVIYLIVSWLVFELLLEP